MKSKQKIRVFQFRKDLRIGRITVTEKKLEIADLRYVIVDDLPIEIKPEYVFLTREGIGFIPVIMIDDEHNLISPNRLLSITFP